MINAEFEKAFTENCKRTSDDLARLAAAWDKLKPQDDAPKAAE